MNPETNSANTEDWLGATKRMRIRAYVEAYTPTMNVSQTLRLHRDIRNAFRGISVPFQPELSRHPSPLETEFQVWDSLSDEALNDFEQELD